MPIHFLVFEVNLEQSAEAVCTGILICYFYFLVFEGNLEQFAETVCILICYFYFLVFEGNLEQSAEAGFCNCYSFIFQFLREI
jgi:Ca2+/Na+ antiporter